VRWRSVNAALKPMLSLGKSKSARKGRLSVGLMRGVRFQGHGHTHRNCGVSAMYNNKLNGGGEGSDGGLPLVGGLVDGGQAGGRSSMAAGGDDGQG
jgi:hypothetical protein